MATKVRTTTIERETPDEEQLDDDETTSPLFDRTRDKKSKSIDRISVYRVDPDEGHLGYLAPDADEKEIRAKWGGGEYRLQGKNSSGQIVQTITSYKISGDPIFQSDIAAARWERLNKIHQRAGGTEAPASSIKEILTTMEERERQRREEERERREEERRDRLEREEKARKEQQAHEEKLAREAADREERRRKDDEERAERRRVEQRQDEERRARLHREDIERMEKANQAQLLQTQQFFQQLTTINKREAGAAGAVDPVKMLTTGMEIALKMSGGRGGGDGEPPDALTALLSRLPETLGELRSTAKEAYQEIKKKNPAPRQLSPGPGSDADHPEVTISGPTAARLQQAIEILKQSGKDPESFIDGMANHVIKLARGQAAPPPTRAKARTAPRARPPTAKPAEKRAAAARRAPAKKGHRPP